MRRTGKILVALVAMAGVGCRAACHEASWPDDVVPQPEKAEGVDVASPLAATAEPASAKAPLAFGSLAQALAAAERTPADRALDVQRKPQELFDFLGIAPGQKVLEIAAGGGYTTELLAHAVGESGTVYGQNSPFILERFAEKPWSERLQKPAMKNVVRVDSEFDAPVPAGVSDLDAVLLVLFYHDAVWMKTDRAALNQKVFAALRPGGIYGVVDHSARASDGVTQSQTLHRIEQSVVVAEVTAAGFELEAEADFLRNPDDARDWSASPSQAGARRGTSDRFVLRFVKPRLATAVPAENGEPPLTACPATRSALCTREYRPVCAQVDTGVRCVRAPCPASEWRTYSNACTACADEKVTGHRSGSCD